MFCRWTDAELTTATARARTAKQFSEYNDPDAVVEWNNGKQWVVDFKCMLRNGTKIRERLNDAYMQADYAIIKIKGKVKDMEQVTNEIDAFLKSRPLFKGVVVFDHRNNVIYKTI